ncbi:hypothetical protein PHLCEN_2v3974 [Hermanssonia centrifuga]|uniref:Uncharacterized protein n=1 Tax=Hermanssonia centrifuga TaxID=98765 RepID=A0A2R6Q7J5_9APHY|nr:hypothetical protein PHLCEN_2v3974 [Hermanssonia centrifuga]
MSDTDADSTEIDQYIDLYRRLLVENYCILATSGMCKRCLMLERCQLVAPDGSYLL